jgi:hypothetical protein
VALFEYVVGSWVARRAGQLRHGPAWPQAAWFNCRICHHHLRHSRMAGTVCLSAGCPPMEHLLRVPQVLTMNGQGHMQAKGPSVFSVVSSISGGCSRPDIATIVDISACSGDVQFRWAHWVHAGQASLAMEPLPDAGCHVCGRQLVCTAQCGTEGRSYYVCLGACTYFCIESRCGLLPDCSAQGSLQFAVVLEACSACIEPQRDLLPPGLSSPRVTSISCVGSW